MIPRTLAHRGASGHAPENTLDAFRAAVSLGANGVELDVHTTADGQLVVHHDPAIPGFGPIATLRWGEVAQVPRPGSRPVPLLEEALAALGDMEVWVEIKALPSEADTHLLAVLAAGPSPGRYAVHGFDHRVVTRLGRLNPGLRRGVLSTSYPLDPIGPVRAAGAQALWQEWHLIDPDLVGRAHDAGIEVIAWTVNERRDAEALAAIGVDALCGNYPERLKMG